MPLPKFTATPEETDLIRRIAVCAEKEFPEMFRDWSRTSLEMDLEAAHCNGCPIDLQKLLAAPRADFGHDVFGIRSHVNRETGELEDMFTPRCARPAVRPSEN